MKTFVEKPQEVRAVQWNGSNEDEIYELFDLVAGDFDIEVDDRFLTIMIIQGGSPRSFFGDIPVNSYVYVDIWDLLCWSGEEDFIKQYEPKRETKKKSDKDFSLPGISDWMKSKKYSVFFRMPSIGETKTSTDKGIPDIKNGFWVNTNLQITNGEDAKYFIPASKITLIVKN